MTMRPTRVMAALLALGLLCCKKPEGARPPAGPAAVAPQAGKPAAGATAPVKGPWAEVFPGYRAIAGEDETAAADAKQREEASGEHDEECAEVFTATRAVKAELAAERPGLEM